jgi:hypothetical protein
LVYVVCSEYDPLNATGVRTPAGQGGQVFLAQRGTILRGAKGNGCIPGLLGTRSLVTEATETKRFQSIPLNIKGRPSAAFLTSELFLL